jgi:hypothetical protein
MAKFEVKICYSGYVTIETEAKDKTEAWDKAQKEIQGQEFLESVQNHTFYPDEENDLVISFLDSLERWDEADQINQIE